MSGKIPRAFIDEVLARTSLVDVIDIHVSLTKRGKNHIACCPFHHEKTPSFNVIADKQFYYCFGCGASGNAISFEMDYLKKDFVTAIEDLASLVGLEVPREAGQSDKYASQKKAYGFLDEVSHLYAQTLAITPSAQQYLQQRVISAEALEHFQIGFAPDEWHFLSKKFPSQQPLLLETGMLVENDKGNKYDRYRGRIMFPIHDKRGRVVGFGGRVTAPEQKPKYLNSPETAYFRKSYELYGLYQVIQSSPEQVLIVEGYMDVVGLFENGVKNAVATLGTATTEHHIKSLFKVTKNLVFCFDGDEAGRKAAARAMELALPLVKDDESIQFMFLPEGEDPDSYIQKIGNTAFNDLITKAPSLYDFFFQRLKLQVNSNSPQDRSKLISLAKPYLSEMPDGALKALIVDQLALLSHLDKSQLQQIIKGNAPIEQPVMRQHQQRPKPSAMRVAIAILIQHPALFEKIKDTVNLPTLIQNDNPILGRLLQDLEGKTHTSQILESWRNDPQFSIVSKLATLPTNIPEDGLVAELKGALQQIDKKTLQTQIDRLLYKANIESLSQDEKKQLQGMIRRQKLLA